MSALPAHVAHSVVLQAEQVSGLSGGSNWPAGQALVHTPWPPVCSSSDPTRHAVQLVGDTSHAAHEASHSAQEGALPLLPSTYLPEGQVPTHAPPSKYGVSDAGQLRQAEVPGPEHCRHEEWHAAQCALSPAISAYVPFGGHSATHVLS